jgi:hypothetical protein
MQKLRANRDSPSLVAHSARDDDCAANAMHTDSSGQSPGSQLNTVQ